jgi:hypothetical protein
VALQDVALWRFVTRDEADAWAGLRIIPKISQETLAEIIGTTRPRVNAFMKKFREPSFGKRKIEPMQSSVTS